MKMGKPDPGLGVREQIEANAFVLAGTVIEWGIMQDSARMG